MPKKKTHPNYYKGKYDKVDRKTLEQAVMDALNAGWTPKARKASAAKCGLVEATFVKYAERCATEMLASRFGSVENAKNIAVAKINGDNSMDDSTEEVVNEPRKQSQPQSADDICRKYGLRVE